jgi:hypothetical protein
VSGSVSATLSALPLVRRASGAAAAERVLELAVDLPAAAAGVRLVVALDGRDTVHDLGPVPAGASTHRIGVPEPSTATRLPWTMRADGRALGGTLELAPARAWRVSLVHFSHHDVGYTDLPSVAARQQLEYLDRVIAYCDETAAYPAAARFRWTLDTSWPLPAWLAGRSPGAAERFSALAREGRVEISALFAAFNAGLPDLEELVRAVSFACGLRRRLRVPVRGAVTTDIPGHPWALVPVLARSGIRYLTTSVNGLYTQDGRLRALEPHAPKPFRWIGPDGSEVLVWNTGPGANYGSEGRDLGFYEDLAAVERRLPAGLAALGAAGYAHEAVSFRVGTDNRPPDRGLSDLVRAWNNRYANPALALDTATGFLAGLEASCQARFEAVRGDWTDWWLDGPGSSARETALSREARERLLAAGAAMALGRLGGGGRVPPAAANAAAPPARGGAGEIGMAPLPRADAAGLAAAYDRLMLYDEHTWGAWDTALAPDSPDVRHHWLEKAIHVYAAERASRDLLGSALADLAARYAVSAGSCLAVFNPCSWTRTEPVLATIPDPLVGGPGCAFRLVDRATGAETAFQVWSRTEHWTWRCETTIAFFASDVPGFGWRVYDLVRADRAAAAPAARPVPDGMENGTLRLAFSGSTGGIASLRDLRYDRELVDTSSGFALGQYLYDAGEPPKNTRFLPSLVSLGDPEIGPVFARMRSLARCEATPSVRLEAVLWAGTARLDLRLEIEKCETLAKEGAYAAFPLAVPGGTFTVDVPGAAVRPGIDQLPGACTDWYAQRRWVDVGTDRCGVLWAGRDAPVVSLGAIGTRRMAERFEQRGTGIFAYLLNNAWDTNFKESQGGRLSFRFSLAPREGPVDPAAANAFGAAVCSPMPCVAVPAGAARGEAARDPASAAPLLSLDGDGLLCESLVPAEDGRGAIMRLREIRGRLATAVIGAPSAGISAAWRTNPMGDDAGRIAVSDGQVLVDVGPNGFADVRLESTGAARATGSASAGGVS